MSKSARLRQREEKQPLEAQPWGEESDIDAEAKHFTQLATDLYIHCRDAKDFEPQRLEDQLQELARNYASNFSCRPDPRPTSPHSTQQAEQGIPNTEKHNSPCQDTPKGPSKKKVHYFEKDRIALQRIRDGDLRDGQSTSIPDQGIRFDKEGHPWDKGDHNNRRDRPPPGRTNQPAQSHAGRGGNPGGDGDGSDTSGSSPDSSYNETSDETTVSSSRTEEDIPRHASPGYRRGERTRSRSRRNPSGNSISRHRTSSPYWSTTSHPNSYQEKGSSHPSKYLRDIHKKIHRQIDSKVAVSSDIMASGGKNGPRVPNPPKYGGLPDTEGFECWLNALLWWLKVNKICSPELDSDHMEFTAMFLENTALTWFEDSVDGAYRQ